MIWIGYLFAIFGLLMASLPALMYLANRRLFLSVNEQDLSGTPSTSSSISLLIPARDEAEGIEESVRTALQSSEVELEVVVLDDHSTDRTQEIVRQLADEDSRVRLAMSQPLPDGWNGKQHACYQLAELAKYDTIVFMDADVRLEPSGLRRLDTYRQTQQLPLVSAFPRQVTGTILEKAIIPMMHFILLGYLPMSRMRSDSSPAFASGCGQLFMTDKDSYRRAGTHQAIQSSRHDGIKLPKVYRQSGQMTDVVDGTKIASCRMYRSASQVVHGVLKNATEGIANPKLIVPFTVFLLGSTQLPLVVFVLSLRASEWGVTAISLLALLISHIPRGLAVIDFQQSKIGFLLHVPATIIFVGLQWIALLQKWTGQQVAWRGRTDLHDAANA